MSKLANLQATSIKTIACSWTWDKTQCPLSLHSVVIEQQLDCSPCRCQRESIVSKSQLWHTRCCAIQRKRPRQERKGEVADQRSSQSFATQKPQSRGSSVSILISESEAVHGASCKNEFHLCCRKVFFASHLCQSIKMARIIDGFSASLTLQPEVRVWKIVLR